MTLRIFSCAYWLFVYHSWRNIFSSPLCTLSCLFVDTLKFFILVIRSLSDTALPNIFAHSIGSLSLSWSTTVDFCEVQFIDFFLLVLLVSYVRIHFQTQGHQEFSPVFPSRSFIVLALTFRCLIHFELFYMVWGRGSVKIILLHVCI